MPERDPSIQELAQTYQEGKKPEFLNGMKKLLKKESRSGNQGNVNAALLFSDKLETIKDETQWELDDLKNVMLARHRVIRQAKNKGLRLNPNEYTTLQTMFSKEVKDLEDQKDTEIERSMEEYQNTLSAIRTETNEYVFAGVATKKVAKKNQKELTNDITEKEKKVLEALFDGTLSISVFKNEAGEDVKRDAVPEDQQERIHSLCYWTTKVNRSSFFRLVTRTGFFDEIKGKNKIEMTQIVDQKIASDEYIRIGKKMEKNEKESVVQLLLLLQSVQKNHALIYVKQALQLISETSLMYSPEEGVEQNNALQEYVTMKRYLQTLPSEATRENTDTQKNVARTQLIGILSDTDFDATLYGGVTVKDVQIKGVYETAIKATSLQEENKTVVSKERPEIVVGNILEFLLAPSRLQLLDYEGLEFLQYDTLTGFAVEAQHLIDGLMPEDAEFQLVQLLKKYPHVADYLRKFATMFGTNYLFELFTQGDHFDVAIAEQQQKAAVAKELFDKRENELLASVIDEKLKGLPAAIQKQLEEMERSDRVGGVQYTDDQKTEIKKQLEGMQLALEDNTIKNGLKFELANILAVLLDGKFYGVGATGNTTLARHKNAKETLSGALDLNVGAAYLGSNTANKSILGLLGVTYKGATTINKQKTISLVYGVTTGGGLDVTNGLLLTKNVFGSVGAVFVLNKDSIDGLGGQSEKSVFIGTTRNPITGFLALNASVSNDKLAAIKEGKEKLLTISNNAFEALFTKAAQGEAVSREDISDSVKKAYIATQTLAVSGKKSEKIQKRIEQGKRDAAIEAYTTHVNAGFRMYESALKEVKEKVSADKLPEIIQGFANTVSATMVRDMVNFQLTELTESGLQVMSLGASFVVLPLPMVLANATIGWYKEKGRTLDEREQQAYRDALETGARAKTLTVQRNRKSEYVQNREATDVLNETINAGFDEKEKPLQSDELLEKITIDGDTYMAIPKSFTEKVSVYSAVAGENRAGGKQFLTRYTKGDKEYVLVPKNLVVGLHMLVTDVGKRHVLILGDVALGQGGFEELRSGKNVIDATSRESVYHAQNEQEAKQFLQEYDVGVVRTFERERISSLYEENRRKTLQGFNQDLADKSGNEANPLLSGISSVQLEKANIGPDAEKEPYFGSVTYTVKDNFLASLRTQSNNKFVLNEDGTYTYEDALTYNPKDNTLTLHKMTGSIKMVYSEKDDLRDFSYETNGNIDIGFLYEKESFETSAEGEESIVMDLLPEGFKTFLNTEAASKVFLTMRYGELGPNAGAAEDNEYLEYYAAMKQGTDDGYITAKNLLLNAMKIAHKKYDVDVEDNEFSERLDLSSNRDVALAVLKQVNGELSRTWTTEFKHLSMNERKAKAQEILNNLQLSGQEKQTLQTLITKFFTEGITHRDHRAIFKQHEVAIEHILGVRYGVDQYDYHLRGGNQREIRRFQLRCLLEPDAEVMIMRDNNFAKKIVTTPGYKNTDPYGIDCRAIEIAARQAVITNLKTSETAVSGLYDEEVGHVDAGVVATYERDRIGFKQVPDPRVVPGSEVNISEILKTKNPDVRRQYYELYLDQLLNANEDQIRHEINKIRTARERVQNKNTNAKFNRNERNLMKPDSITDVAAAKNQLVNFMLDEQFGTFTLFGGSYGPCKNRFKYHAYGLKYTTQDKKEFTVEGTDIPTVEQLPLGRVAVAAETPGGSPDIRTKKLGLGGVDVNIPDRGPTITDPGLNPHGKGGVTITDPGATPSDNPPVIVITGGPNTTQTWGSTGGQVPGSGLGQQTTQVREPIPGQEVNTGNDNLPLVGGVSIGTLGSKPKDRKTRRTRRSHRQNKSSDTTTKKE